MSNRLGQRSALLRERTRSAVVSIASWSATSGHTLTAVSGVREAVDHPRRVHCCLSVSEAISEATSAEIGAGAARASCPSRTCCS